MVISDPIKAKKILLLEWYTIVYSQAFSNYDWLYHLATFIKDDGTERVTKPIICSCENAQF